jgi:hypothetical protein
MEMLKMYYYTSIPLVTCNVLFYSLTSISNSITSSQNVVKFLSECKQPDTVLFKNKIEENDLEHKLKIIKSLIYDAIKIVCKDDIEYEQTKKELENLQITTDKDVDNNDYAVIEITPIPILEKIESPIKLAIISTSEVVQNIDNVIIETYYKINNHNNSFVKRIVSLNLQENIRRLDKYIKILNIRLELLFQLMNIYVSPKIK